MPFYKPVYNHLKLRTLQRVKKMTIVYFTFHHSFQTVSIFYLWWYSPFYLITSPLTHDQPACIGHKFSISLDSICTIRMKTLYIYTLLSSVNQELSLPVSYLVLQAELSQQSCSKSTIMQIKTIKKESYRSLMGLSCNSLYYISSLKRDTNISLLKVWNACKQQP